MADVLSIISFLICAVFMFYFLHKFGLSGLFVYSVIIVIASNIQVLKVAKYSFFDVPVPLGTVLFSTMFAVDNIINEHFGLKQAKKCVYIGFIGYLFFAILMILADWHPVVQDTSCANMYNEIHSLFSPSIVFFISSISAFLIGQLCDVYVFDYLKKKINNLSARSCLTMTLSTFVDNFVFSVLAWKILSSMYIPWHDIFYTYILGSSLFRFAIAIVCVPLVKLSGRFIKKVEC